MGICRYTNNSSVTLGTLLCFESSMSNPDVTYNIPILSYENDVEHLIFNAILF